MQDEADGAPTPLSEVTFVVLDLETTGGSPEANAITELGAVRIRGGVELGSFQTLVNPGVRLPHEVRYLTGITEAMLAPAPLIESVLPTFLEFIGASVIVGHNVRFDLAFLRANLRRLGYPPPGNDAVDTCALARRLVGDEVADCTLRTLARHFGTDADPCHRAFDDARATVELLHHLLERAGTLGVDALDDLLVLPRTAAHPQVAKLRWVADLPRVGGVYLFRDRAGVVLHVGRSRNIRRRVRSYFASRDRRLVGPLLREAQSLEHIACASELEARVVELRLLHQHRPRFNRNAPAGAARYVELVPGTRHPRPRVVRTPRAPGCGVHLGPFASLAEARPVADAVETYLSLAARSPQAVEAAALAIAGEVDLVTAPLLAHASHLEAAGAPAAAPDAASALAGQAHAFGDAVERQRRRQRWVRDGRLDVEVGGARVVLDGDGLAGIDARVAQAARSVGGSGRPMSLAAAAELDLVTAWVVRASADRATASEDASHRSWTPSA